MRVLIVDDDHHMHAIYHLALRTVTPDIQPDFAETYQESLYYLQQSSYEWCFLDQELPDGQGVELLALATQKCDHVLMITGNGHDPAFCRRAEQLGAEEVIAKPVCLSSLLQRLFTS